MNANAEQPIYTADEFERESRYLETLVWEAMVVEPGSRILFCGYGPDGAQVRRAVDEGADVTVIEHRDSEIRRFAQIGAKLLRGSTSVIPARENTFDLAVSFHYLHEVDPFFHGQVLSELSRVAKRIAIVEPAPPADPLGKRIALLYSQAKRELGQFEYYQPMEYWKKLLQAVKADVSQHVFAFAKVPPHEYLLDSVDLLLDTMEVEEAPPSYIEELRAIARRSDVQLLPPPRYVLVGSAVGEMPLPKFTTRAPGVDRPARAVPPQPTAAAPPPAAPPAPANAAATAQRSVDADSGYEFPVVEPPVAAPNAQAPAAAPPAPPAPAPAQAVAPAIEPPPGFVPGLPFGAPAPPDQPGGPQPPVSAPFGSPFAMPGAAPAPFGVPPAGVPPSSSWQWEPPDDGDDEKPFGF